MENGGNHETDTRDEVLHELDGGSRSHWTSGGIYRRRSQTAACSGDEEMQISESERRQIDSAVDRLRRRYGDMGINTYWPSSSWSAISQLVHSNILRERKIVELTESLNKCK